LVNAEFVSSLDGIDGVAARVRQRHPSLGLQATQGMYVTEAWYWDLNDQTASGASVLRQDQENADDDPCGVYSATTMLSQRGQATGTDDADAVMCGCVPASTAICSART